MDHKYIVLDIETNGLQPDKIWMVGIKDHKHKNTQLFLENDKTKLKEWLNKRKDYVIVGHGIRSFDLPWLYKLWGIEITNKIYDTLENSRKIVGDIPGGHSLKTWGLRLCQYKGDFSNFDKLSSEMKIYCKQDVLVSESLYKLLIRL